MKTLALIVALSAFHIFAYGQHNHAKYSAHGVIRSRVNHAKLIFTLLSLTNNSTREEHIAMTNSHGRFHFEGLQNGNYTLRLTGEKNYSLDSTITINDKSLRHIKTFVTAICYSYKAETAQHDIQNGNLKLLLQGGYAPLHYTNQHLFEEKYNVKYQEFGCVAPDNYDCLIIYNKEMFAYLDKRFGRKWRKEVRRDVIGFRK